MKIEGKEFTCPKCGYTWKPRKVYPPNWCANRKCGKPLTEEAERRALQNRMKSALRKIEDKEKFITMWEAGAGIEEIAKEFDINAWEVVSARMALKLAPRPRARGWIRYKKKEAESNNRKVINVLKKCGGYCELKKLYAHVPYTAVRRLLNRRLIFKIEFNLGRSSGAYKRNIHKHIFKKEVLMPNNWKTFICVDRTAVVRVLGKFLQKPKDEHIQATITSFLRNYLSDAEKFAVLWKLGVRKFSSAQIKRSIQIDGIIGPIRTQSQYLEERIRKPGSTLKEALSSLEDVEEFA